MEITGHPRGVQGAYKLLWCAEEMLVTCQFTGVTGEEGAVSGGMERPAYEVRGKVWVRWARRVKNGDLFWIYCGSR